MSRIAYKTGELIYIPLINCFSMNPSSSKPSLYFHIPRPDKDLKKGLHNKTKQNCTGVINHKRKEHFRDGSKIS